MLPVQRTIINWPKIVIDFGSRAHHSYFHFSCFKQVKKNCNGCSNNHLHYAKVNNCANFRIMQDARYNKNIREKLFKMPNYAKARLYHVPQYANCIIMQYMKLSEVQNYARCQILESKKLCKIIQNTKQSNVHIYAKFACIPKWCCTRS